MQIFILITLCFALCYSQKALAEGKNEVRRGEFSYMAFVYYLDPSIVDKTGARFTRGAVLIQPNLLITSALSPINVNDASTDYPRKTLLARLGAVTIDANFTLNEDEYEQEREVIQVFLPFNYSATQWWRTDIALMKTLLPFIMTSAVGVTTLNYKHDYSEKTCLILVYAQKFGNSSEEEKNLMQYAVVLLPASIENCGSHFLNQTMTCATDIDENVVSDPNFCHGNSGGPLLCDGKVAGLQTYIENNCKEPHLYQRLSSWDKFINCGINDKCQQEQCKNVCDVINKDAPDTKVIVNPTFNTDFITFGSTETTDDATTTTSPSTLPNTKTGDIDIPTTITVSTYAEATEVSMMMDTANTTRPKSLFTSSGEVTHIKTWPSEIITTQLTKLEEEERVLKNERKPEVEARRHHIHNDVIAYNATPRNMYTFQNPLFALFFLTYFV